MGSIKFSVAMPPGPDVVERAQLAQDLGYDRISAKTESRHSVVIFSGVAGESEAPE